MSKPRLIGHALETTDPGIRRRRDIPEDLLREASSRLRIVALLGAILWFSCPLIYHFAQGALSHGAQPWYVVSGADAIAAAYVLFSLTIYWQVGRSKAPPRVQLDRGLLYLVLVSLGIGLMWHWDPMPHTHDVEPTFTWVGPLLLMFAAILPNPPRKTLVAGLLAASMNPIGMLIAKARGTWDFGPWTNVLLMHYPDYILVGISVVISHVVTRLGQKVSSAREMGSYHLGELLGRGGMGEVYRATHRMLARPAAIKLIRPEMIAVGHEGEGELAMRRFRREAEVAASLRSPHTVELYDFGITEDETLYYAMELLEGMDLEALVRTSGPLPVNRAVFILTQVCQSLAEAHARGLVHRDIKPANIHVGSLGLEHDFAKVLDFGLVKAAPGGIELSQVTAAGIAAGTPAYMAPEMVRGEDIDGRADLYALGCVAYYMVAGKPVFEAASALQAIARHLNDKPAPFVERAGVSVPPPFERLVFALLAKRPDERPRSAVEVAHRLAAIEIEPWTEEKAAEWWRRRESTASRGSSAPTQLTEAP